jgi:transposase
VLSLSTSVQVYVCTRPADMRKSFDSLAAMVRECFGQDPLSGRLFVFRNRPADRLKILWWEGDGFVLWYKRLEKGTFRLPTVVDGSSVRVTPAELMMILEGIDLSGIRRQKRFALPAAPASVDDQKI